MAEVLHLSRSLGGRGESSKRCRRPPEALAFDLSDSNDPFFLYIDTLIGWNPPALIQIHGPEQVVRE